MVAPYVGAWIETIFTTIVVTIVQSHPTWVRGLKPKEMTAIVENAMSHPTWVRGLKLVDAQIDNVKAESHPTWVRGLKPMFLVVTHRVSHVAPYVGAWIETHRELCQTCGQ